MILICTLDDRLARALRRSIKGAVQCVASYDRCVETMASERPAALLLDVRSGGTTARAVERVPWMQQASPLTAIVVLTVKPTAEEIDEIETLGAYTWVDLAARDLPSQVRSAVGGAMAASSSSPAWARMRRRQIH